MAASLKTETSLGAVADVEKGTEPVPNPTTDEDDKDEDEEEYPPFAVCSCELEI